MNLEEFKKMWEDWSFREEENHVNKKGHKVIEFAMTLVNLGGKVYDESYGRHMACRLIFDKQEEIIDQEFWNIVRNGVMYQIVASSGDTIAPTWFRDRFNWATDTTASTIDTFYHMGSDATGY